MSEILCPKCGSNQILANKKGFSGKRAVAGAILTGGVGLLAGTIGSNKVIITCLNCANEFKPGARPTVKPPVTQPQESSKEAGFFFWFLTVVFSTVTYFLYDSNHTFFGAIFLIVAIISLIAASACTFVKEPKSKKS